MKKNPELPVLLLRIILLFGSALTCDLGKAKQPTPVATQTVEATLTPPSAS